MRDHAGLNEGITELIEVQAPGIAGAVREDLKFVPGRVIAPNAGVDRRAILVRSAGLANATVGEHTMTAVQPAIRAPRERVERFVRVLMAPAIEENLGFAGLVGLRVVRNEHEVRRRPDPHAAKAHLDSTDQVQAFEEGRSLVEFAVAVGVLKDQDLVAVLALGRRQHRPGKRETLRVGIGLDHPQPAPVVGAHGHGLVNIGFAGKELDRETLGHGHRLGRLLGRQAGVFERIGRSRLRLGGDLRLFGMKAEVVEIHMAPVTGVFVNDADVNFLALQVPQVDCDALQFLGFLAAGAKNQHLRVGPDDLHTSVRVRSAGDQKTSPGMRDLEGDAGEHADRRILDFLVTADPVIALMLAAHVAASGGDGVALDRLALEGGAGGGPVLQSAGFKVEIERFAIGAHRQHTIIGPGRQGHEQEQCRKDTHGESFGG